MRNVFEDEISDSGILADFVTFKGIVHHLLTFKLLESCMSL